MEKRSNLERWLKMAALGGKKFKAKKRESMGKGRKN